MQTLQEIYTRHQAPQDEIVGTGGDKGTYHSYIEVYAELFQKFRDQPINLLEIGVQHGYSVRMWKEFFPKATIFGIDIDPRCAKHQQERIKIFIMDATRPEMPKGLQTQTFEIIIDDGSHQVKDQQQTFKIFYPKLNPQGLYIIEDILQLDDYRNIYQAMHPKVQILDRRKIKNRFDDVLVVINKD